MQTAPVALIRRMEKQAVDSGIPEYELMLRAGIQAAHYIRKHFPDAGRFVILCGGGNNGGDALVAARHLLPAEVIIYSTVEKNTFTGCAANAVRDLPETIPFIYRQSLSHADFFPGDVIIDGLLGIGFSGGRLRESTRSFIAAANAAGLPVVALDVPSGIEADSGFCADNGALRADITLTFGRPKSGLFQNDGSKLRGALRVLNIGLSGDESSGMRVFTNLDAVNLIPHFPVDCHKNSRGRVLIWGGSPEYPGAAALSSLAALKSGTGIVRCASEADLSGRLCNAVIFEKLASGGVPEKSMAFSGVLVCGCGWGSCASRENLLRALEFPGKVILDADALNIAAQNPDCWKIRKNLVLTPHPGEAARLLKAFRIASSGDRLTDAANLAAQLHAVVILKGRDSVAAAPGHSPVTVAAGSPMLATAGSGDVLAGVIGALAESLEIFDAAVLGAYVHGVAGEMCNCIPVADELPQMVSEVIVKLQRNQII
ncbi:MAG: NAD(P)H-hydrate dehydratase [Lentisphaeria bacterium]|nr:NAD(P)H-hydrate dehydratase [Lentisphaeria bacterium]